MFWKVTFRAPICLLLSVLCSLLWSRRKAGKPASPANTKAHPRKHLMINSWFSFPPPSLNRHLRYDTQRFENGRLRKPPLLEISFGTRGSIISMLTHKKFCGSTCIQLSFSNFLKIQFSSGRKQFVEAPHANLAWSVIVNHGDGTRTISFSPSAIYRIFSLI